MTAPPPDDRDTARNIAGKVRGAIVLGDDDDAVNLILSAITAARAQAKVSEDDRATALQIVGVGLEGIVDRIAAALAAKGAPLEARCRELEAEVRKLKGDLEVAQLRLAARRAS